jgi:uncharacterized repeat protein (TIGR03803 family)
MKKSLLFAVVLFVILFTSAHSQTLYGTTSNSGLYGGGTIYKYDMATATKSDVFDFPIVNDIETYSASLCELNGKFYGTTTEQAGRYRTQNGKAQGLLFEYNPTTNIHTVLYQFGDATSGEAGSNGGQPIGSLIPYNGKLYGVTAAGGSTASFNLVGAGVLFEYNPSSSTYTKLKDIDVNNGSANSPLVLASDGSFYGVCKGNGFGTNANGLVYRYNLAANTLSIAAGFPTGATNFLKNCNSIRQAANGKIYGIAEGKVSTATNNVIFECDIVANTITQKASFGSTTLLQSINTILFDGQNGSFYGYRYGSGGSIFEYNIASDVVTTKYTFNATTGTPYIGVGINPTAGKFYGHTISSAANPYGEIFEYNYNTNTYSVAIAYNASTGIYGVGNIFFASNNKAYSYCSYKPGFVIGTTLQELDFSTNTSTTKIDYNTTVYGTKPIGNLLKGSDGKLYGTTTLGGTKNYGCFFSFDPTTHTMVNIQNFADNIGRTPNADLVEVGGKIYGTTYEGGSNATGTLFEYTIATNTYVVKKTFTSFPATVGYYPVNGLIVGQNGKLYGQTKQGVMPANNGIFEYDIATNALSLVFAFATNTNAFRGGFVEGASGVFYGYYGRYLYKVDINSNTQSTLADFYTMAGGDGSGRPLVSNGAVYCLLDGVSCFGVVKHDIVTATNTFNACNGTTTGPGLYGGIIKTSNNKMYFNTNTMPVNSSFVHRVARVYELNPTTLATTSMCTLEASMGQYPLGLLTEANAAPLSIKGNSFVNNFKIYPNPSSGNFNIEIDENLIGAKATLYNLLGQKVKDINLNSTSSIQTLNKGIYVLEIEKDGIKSSKKLIVN